jgi:type IV secretion system protein TrbC
LARYRLMAGLSFILKLHRGSPTKHWTRSEVAGYARFHKLIRTTNTSDFRRRIDSTKGDHCTMRYAIRVPAHLSANLFGNNPVVRRARARLVTAASALAALLVAAPLRAQQDPWEQAVQVLQTAFTGPIAKGLSLVAIVVGGLMFAFGEGQSKRALSGIIFGVGMAIGAVNFMAWLFP